MIIGTGIGGLITLEEQIAVYREKGAGRVSPFLVPMMMTNATAGTVAMQLGWTGPEPVHLHRVRGQRPRDRRGGAPHSRRRPPTS